jgi:hypothetical protein
MFIETRGAPVTYRGRSLVMLDRVSAKLGERFTVTIEATSSPYPQGLGVSEGVEVFGERAKRAVIWEYFSLPPVERGQQRSKLPFRFEVVCRNRRGHVAFYNMTEYQGRQEWWHGGSCMVVKEIPGGRRYHCNDFELDEDFDDLVFSVVRGGAGHDDSDLTFDEAARHVTQKNAELYNRLA